MSHLMDVVIYGGHADETHGTRSYLSCNFLFIFP